MNQEERTTEPSEVFRLGVSVDEHRCGLGVGITMQNISYGIAEKSAG